MQTEYGYIQPKDYLPKPDDKPIYKGVPINIEGQYKLNWEIDLDLYKDYAIKKLTGQSISFSYKDAEYSLELSRVTDMLVLEKEVEVFGKSSIELTNTKTQVKELVEVDSDIVNYLKTNVILPKSIQIKTNLNKIKNATTLEEITGVLN